VRRAPLSAPSKASTRTPGPRRSQETAPRRRAPRTKPTSHPRPFPGQLEQRAQDEGQATRWARNQTSPSSAHHHTSVPATKNRVRYTLVARSLTPNARPAARRAPSQPWRRGSRRRLVRVVAPDRDRGQHEDRRDGAIDAVVVAAVLDRVHPASRPVDPQVPVQPRVGHPRVVVLLGRTQVRTYQDDDEGDQAATAAPENRRRDTAVVQKRDAATIFGATDSSRRNRRPAAAVEEDAMYQQRGPYKPPTRRRCLPRSPASPDCSDRCSGSPGSVS